MPKIVRMNLLRRYPIAFTLMALVIVSALAPLPPLVDAVTGAPPYDVDLVRPATYTLLAPLLDVLDALTFLSIGRAWWFLVVWVIGLAAWGVAVELGAVDHGHRAQRNHVLAVHAPFDARQQRDRVARGVVVEDRVVIGDVGRLEPLRRMPAREIASGPTGSSIV